MAKGVAKVQHERMKPIEGAGFSLRGFRRAPGSCECGGVSVYAKIARVKGGNRMGTTCAGREALKRKAWFTTEDGKTTGAEITEERYKHVTGASDFNKEKPSVMEGEAIVRPEIKSCGAILGRGKGNIFGAA